MILSNSRIFVFNNHILYKEGDYHPYMYIILYGKIFLKNKSTGIFSECIAGDTFAEENIIDQQSSHIE